MHFQLYQIDNYIADIKYIFSTIKRIFKINVIYNKRFSFINSINPIYPIV